jgi:two-component system, NarL family, sensor kinase
VSRRRNPLTVEVVRFGLAGLVAVTLLGGILLALLSRIATNEALSNARERTRLAGWGIVEPLVSADLLGTPEEASASVAALDAVIQTRVLSATVLRVKIWTPEGRILYSDEPRLVGKKFPPKADHAKAIETGQIFAELGGTNGPENAFERNTGDLLEVYMPLRASDGTQLVYEQYERYDSIVGNSRKLVRRLALPLFGCVLMLWFVQLPLARRLANRARRAEAEHAELANQALTASGRERERIAANLHDGVVQDLAGLTYELSALAARTDPGSTRTAIERSAEISRTAMRRVRTSLVELHPPTIESIGLAAGLEQLAEPLRRNGTDVGIDVDIVSTSVNSDTQALLYRLTRELLLNVDEHAHATKADVAVSRSNDAQHTTLVVSDNGTGVSETHQAQRRAEGHLGLELHRALVTRAGGTMTIDSVPGSGTTITVELPS